MNTPLPGISRITGKTPNSGAVQVNIAKLGYVEREYRVTIASPLAYSYVGATTAVTSTAAPTSPDGAYRSRFFIRYPSNPKKFNGRVIVEMLNTTAFEDMDIVWMQSQQYLMNQGYAYVGLTVQQTGLNPLKTFVRDAARYAALGLNLMTPDAAAAVAKYDFTGNRDATVAWDLVSQVGQLFKTNGTSSPMHSYAVKKVYLTGQSQMAGYMVTYVNAIHPLAHVYDGFLVVSGGPYAKSLGYDPTNAFTPSDAQVTLNGGGTPVLFLQTQTDIHPGTASRRPDANTPTDRFRLWEVPGAAHLDGWTARQIITALQRDSGAAIALPCNWNKTRTITEFPMRYAVDAAVNALNIWVSNGKAPSSAPRIAVTADTQSIQLDKYGNALGGIRLPSVAAPLDSYTASSTGGGFCFLAGNETPLSRATVKSLYATPSKYVAKVTAITKADAQRGFLVPFDQTQILAAAKRAKLNGTDR